MLIKYYINIYGEFVIVVLFYKNVNFLFLKF